MRPLPRLETYVPEGHVLLGWTRVALPVQQLQVRVLIEERGSLPDTLRFALAFVDLGFDQLEELAGAMGLEPRICEAILVQAHAMGLLHVGDMRLALTSQGAQALAEADLLRKTEHVVVVGFDRIAKRAIPWHDLPDASLHQPRDAKVLADADELVVVPAKSGNVSIEDLQNPSSLSMEAIGRSLDRLKGSPRYLDTLAIESPQKKFWRSDVFALSVATREMQDRRWEFLVGGSLSDPHATGFIEHQRRRKRRILPEFDEPVLDRIGGTLTPELIREADLADFDRRKAASSVAAQLDDLTERTESGAIESDLSDVAERAKQLEAELESLEAGGGVPRVKILHVEDHRPLLLASLATARYRVLIESPWIRLPAWDDELQSAIVGALERGVHVFIRYGYEGQGTSKQVRDRLTRWEQQFPNFSATDVGNSHIKALAADDFAVAGSFNWLSFLGDPDRTRREEKSYQVFSRSSADEAFRYVLSDEEFEASSPPIRTAVVFVEGWTDRRFMEIAAERAGREDLLAGIEVRECNGAKNMPWEVGVHVKLHPQTRFLALCDSDEPGKKAAREIRQGVDGGKRNTVEYQELLDVQEVKQDAEAEDLFPLDFVHRFVEMSKPDRVWSQIKALKSGGDRYWIASEHKEAFVSFVESHLTPAEADRWLALLELVRKRLGLST